MASRRIPTPAPARPARAAWALPAAAKRHVTPPASCLASDSITTAAPADPSLPFYAHFPLDREAHLRKDAAALHAMFRAPTTTLLPLHDGKALVRPPVGGSAHSLEPIFLLPASDHEQHIDSDTLVFLGTDPQGAAFFAANLPPASSAALAASTPHSTWQPVRDSSTSMTTADAALLAVAHGLVYWHATSPHSPRTGARMRPASGGHARRDPETCTRATYPRIDPAVIALVSCGPFCLLGRKAAWPRGRYSALAGFMEVGETFEQAVAREVVEESAVAVDPPSVAYVASQPWPFPQSLMIGFYANAAPAAPADQDPFTLLSPDGRKAALGQGMPAAEVAAHLLPALQPARADPAELQDARWFHWAYVRAALQQQGSSSGPCAAAGARPGAEFGIPGQHSLAHRLVRGWVAEQEAAAGGGWAGDEVPDVDIDVGVFKYVLMRVEGRGGRSKLLVWGDRRAAYHMHVLQSAKRACGALGLAVEVLGGGRIEHYPEQQVVNIYGYSAAFGPAPHEVSAALVQRWFPLYPKGAVTVSYQGY